jgi:acyl-CoA synthetase (AMP-forming)/AMP-acid ligase II
VPALLDHQTERFPERELLVSDDDRITYGQLDRRSAALAAHLLGQGVGTGTRVGILLPNGPEFLLTFFAIVRIGGVAVPISTFSTGPESMPYRDGDRLFATGPMFWVGGLVTSLLTMLQVGGTLINSSRSGSALLDVIERERCTAIQVWPYLSRRIAEDPTFASRDWRAMRAGTVPEMVSHTGAKPSAPPFGFAMGMTETAGPHTLAMGEIHEEHRGAMGLLAPGMEHRIIDPETRAVLSEGDRGILEVRGDTLMLGYVGRERHETFDADGWFDTGDLCTVRDCHVFFHGRNDAMIKTSGANVSPVEVEAALLEIDGVAEAHVLGLPDVTRGQIVGALIVPQEGRTLDPETVLGEARKRLSSYKVPRRAVIAEKAPLTGTNKLDRRAAARLLQDPVARMTRS